MRSGRLLAEESPRNLLQMYSCASLEDVFLKLSRKQGQYAPPTELNITNNISLVSYIKKLKKKLFKCLTHNLKSLNIIKNKNLEG